MRLAALDVAAADTRNVADDSDHMIALLDQFLNLSAKLRERPREVADGELDVAGGPPGGLAWRQFVGVPLEAWLESPHHGVKVAGVDQLIRTANEGGIGGLGHCQDSLGAQRPLAAAAHRYRPPAMSAHVTR